MRLVRFAAEGEVRLGALEGDEVADLGLAPPTRQLLCADGLREARSLAARATRLPLDQLRLLPPLQPNRLLATGANYRSHLEEVGAEAPPAPSCFLKLPGSLCGPEEDVSLPTGCDAVDYEAEIAVVLGCELYRADAAAAERAIAGVTLANDVTARDLPLAQTVLAKGATGFCPLGPALRTREEMDLGAIEFSLRLNGERRQSASSEDMVRGPVELVQEFSQAMRLLPGDVLLTGTPAGVGVASEPPRFLQNGDVVVIESPQIGTLRNAFRRGSDDAPG